MGFASKGVTFYSYLSSPGFKAAFSARDRDDARLFETSHAHAGAMHRDSREIDPSGRFVMTASRGKHVLLRRNLAGNLAIMLETRSIIAPDHAVSYGFHDAGAYLYVTDSHESWMRDLLEATPVLRTRPFGAFVLPGARDAGMFTGVTHDVVEQIRPFLADGAAFTAAYTQKDDIATQLRLGVRYFDFRPGHDVFDARSALHHQRGAIPGYAFDRFLADIVEFLRCHEGEIVVVHLRYDGFAHPDRMTPASQQVESQIAAAIAGTSLQRGRGDDLALNTGVLLQTGKRLIVLHDDRRVRDSYDADAHASGDPRRVLGRLARTVAGLDGRGDARWAALQLHGACKARFDHAIYPWLVNRANVADHTQRTLIALVNDFADNALVSHAIAMTRQRADR